MKDELWKRNYMHADEIAIKVIDNKGSELKSKRYSEYVLHLILKI